MTRQTTKRRSPFHSYILRGQEDNGTYFISCLFPLGLRNSDITTVSDLRSRLDASEDLRKKRITDIRKRLEYPSDNAEGLREQLDALEPSAYIKNNANYLRQMAKRAEKNLLVMLYRPVGVTQEISAAF